MLLGTRKVENPLKIIDIYVSNIVRVLNFVTRTHLIIYAHFKQKKSCMNFFFFGLGLGYFVFTQMEFSVFPFSFLYNLFWEAEYNECLRKDALYSELHSALLIHENPRVHSMHYTCHHAWYVGDGIWNSNRWFSRKAGRDVFMSFKSLFSKSGFAHFVWYY